MSDLQNPQHEDLKATSRVKTIHLGGSRIKTAQDFKTLQDPQDTSRHVKNRGHSRCLKLKTSSRLEENSKLLQE
jgi:hypothetical protein